MSARSAMHRMLAGKKGVKIVSIGPLGPNLSEEEWKKWLNYIPEFQKERIEYLSNKKAGDLTSSEIEELHRLQKELKMRSISKIYGEEMNKSDALEYMDYSNQKQLSSLIRRKLTDEEYQLAIDKSNQLVSDLSYGELLDYCREQENNFSDLSMVDSFVLRRVSKVVNAISNKKTGEAIAYERERNELMRQRSIKNDSKRYLL